jgi:hypothetical protein
VQFDRTQIVIRERTLSELLDLALVVCRHRPGALLRSAAWGIVPFALCNAIMFSTLLVHYYLNNDFGVFSNGLYPYYATSLGYDNDFSTIWFFYIFSMGTLVYLEAPLALAFTTHYLGKFVFEESPDMVQVRREVWNAWKPLAYYIGFVRLALLAPAIGLLLWIFQIPIDQLLAGPTWLAILAWLIVAPQRALRPYVIEMILLERTPFRATDKTTITFAKRSAALHGSDPGIVGTWFNMHIVGALLILILSGTLVCTYQVVIGQKAWYAWTLLIFGYPLVLWLVALFMTVVRFLKYLDVRIRSEGWEVDLLLRAEAARWENVT